MDIALQIWGGGFYLLNKIFLSYAEGKGAYRKWRIRGWAVYLAGLPAWVIIFVIKRDWIAAGIEAGGVPAMILGLVIALKGVEQTPRLLGTIAKVFAFGLLIVGVIYSFYDYGGLTAFTQVLELGIITGFLIGTYLLAKKNPNGWLWFMFMNASCGTLMAVQDKYILAVQQAISLGFVVWGFYRAKKLKNQTSIQGG